MCDNKFNPLYNEFEPEQYHPHTNNEKRKYLKNLDK